MEKVLFVCLGNICRSPMAEAVFRNIVLQAGLIDNFVIDSAGTSDWHSGKLPHKGTLNKLIEKGISTENMFSRQLNRLDGENFDYIVYMDESNLRNMLELIDIAPSTTVIRLLDLTSRPQNMPDPYYTNDFEETYQLCLSGCEALFEKIRMNN